LGVWGLGVEGRQGLLRLSTAPRESDESGLAVRRALGKRSLQTPVTLPPDGAPGLRTALDVLGPRSLRLRGGLPQRQKVAAHVPALAWPAFQALVVARRAAPRVEEGPRRFQPLLTPDQALAPDAWRGLCDAREARLPHLQVPTRPQQSGRTSHRAERAFEEERRRPQVLPPLGDAQRLRTLVCAVLLRVGERWGTKPCSEFEQPHIRALRQSFAFDQALGTSESVTKEIHPRRSVASAR